MRSLIRGSLLFAPVAMAAYSSLIRRHLRGMCLLSCDDLDTHTENDDADAGKPTSANETARRAIDPDAPAPIAGTVAGWGPNATPSRTDEPHFP
jgi:hypothetical protein